MPLVAGAGGAGAGAGADADMDMPENMCIVWLAEAEVEAEPPIIPPRPLEAKPDRGAPAPAVLLP